MRSVPASAVTVPGGMRRRGRRAVRGRLRFFGMVGVRGGGLAVMPLAAAMNASGQDVSASCPADGSAFCWCSIMSSLTGCEA